MYIERLRFEGAWKYSGPAVISGTVYPQTLPGVMCENDFSDKLGWNLRGRKWVSIFEITPERS